MAHPATHSPSQSEIDAFASRLVSWTESLPTGERSIAQLLVEHARELTPEKIALNKITHDLRQSAHAVIDALNALGQTPEGWVRIDPIWYKKDEVERGEDVEVIQRIFVNTRR